MKIYKCDGPNCNRDSSTKENWLWIESRNGGLSLSNPFDDRAIVSLGNHGGIHFCSRQCFENFFFQPKSNKDEN